MDVEIPSSVRDTAAQLGAGVPYALKVVAGQLADDPGRGSPSALPGILTVMVDGDLFEDCPALAVGYIHEPDRIEIRYVNLAASGALTSGRPDEVPEPSAERGLAMTTVREVSEAWQRITGHLQDIAPDSYAALRPGAGPSAIAAVEDDLGVRIPVELRTLWQLTAGDEGSAGWGCLPGNRALMTLDAVTALYRLKLDAQADEDVLNATRPEDERVTVWMPTWIPVVSLGPADTTSGLYLDASTGYLGRWSRYNEVPGDGVDTLVTYLEEVADVLEVPALAPQDRPGLIGGTLVWLSSIDSTREDRWRPLAD